MRFPITEFAGNEYPSGPGSFTPVGRLRFQQRGLMRHGNPFAGEIIRNRPPKRRIRDEMGAVRRDRKIAAGELVRALRAGLDRCEAVLDGKGDRLIVANLEMQEGMLLDGAPITSVEGVGADEIERAGNSAA